MQERRRPWERSYRAFTLAAVGPEESVPFRMEDEDGKKVKRLFGNASLPVSFLVASRRVLVVATLMA
jgi:hypothetical protein